jgi:hypothetical protein
MENIEVDQEDALEYLAQIHVEAFLKEKGYEPIDWLYGERKWKKSEKISEKEDSLTYNYVESEEHLHKAFSQLFEVTIRMRKEKDQKNEEVSKG